MAIKTVRDLIVWQKAHALVLDLYQYSSKFPKDEKFGLISQLRRAAISVAANIAEGQRKTSKDFVKYLDIAQGSLEETKYHLILSKDLSYLNNQEFNDLYNKSEEIARILFGVISKLRNK